MDTVKVQNRQYTFPNFTQEEWASQVVLGVKKKKKKNSLPMQKIQETWVRSLGQEEPLEEGMANH